MTVTEPIFTELYVNYFYSEFHENPTWFSRLSYVTEGEMDLAST
jgi:hypothetical protein